MSAGLRSGAIASGALVAACVALGALGAHRAHAEPPAKPAPASEPAPPPCVDDERLDRAGDRPRTRVSAKDYLGKTGDALIARFGEPGCKSPTRWRYWQPAGCAYEKDVITLRFERGKVRRVHVAHIITGEECMSVD